MDLLPTSIPDLKLVQVPRHEDERGWFAETYHARAWRDLGVGCQFVQDNAALSLRPGTIRGLHFQHPPAAQAKLVRCARGAIYDVALDLRQGSPWFGCHFATELSAENGRQMFIPPGFAHGYCTLEAACEVAYKVDTFYAPDLEGGILWDDPHLAIAWPVKGDAAHLSPKDRRWPRLTEAETPFAYRAPKDADRS